MLGTIFSAIIAVAILVVVVLVIKYYTGKHKTHHQRTGAENIAKTLGNSITKSVKDIGKGMRDFETVRSEYLSKLDDKKNAAETVFKTYLGGVLMNEKTHEKILKNSNENIAKYKKMAKEKKEEFEKSGDERFKVMTEKVITQILKLQSQIEISTKVIEDAEIKKMQAEFDYNLTLQSIENKRSEIMSAICNENGGYDLGDIELDNLSLEFKEKAESREITNEVNSIIAGTKANNEDAVPTEDIQKYFDSI